MSSPALNVDERLLDAVATAYADSPGEVEPLLLELADAASRAAYMRAYAFATDYGRESAAAAVDAARDELLAVLDLPEPDGAAP